MFTIHFCCYVYTIIKMVHNIRYNSTLLMTQTWRIHRIQWLHISEIVDCPRFLKMAHHAYVNHIFLDKRSEWLFQSSIVEHVVQLSRHATLDIVKCLVTSLLDVSHQHFFDLTSLLHVCH